MKKLHTRKGGFTLIELMIVVAIIGILAAIAIPNFLRFQLKAKSSEGKTNLAAIRTAEQSYYSEFGVLRVGRRVADGRARQLEARFGAEACNNGTTGPGFTTLGWSPEGNVYFSYAVGTGAAGASFFATAERRHRRRRHDAGLGLPRRPAPAVAAARRPHLRDLTAGMQPQRPGRALHGRDGPEHLLVRVRS